MTNYDPDLEPILQELQDADTALAQRIKSLEDRLGAAPGPQPVPEPAPQPESVGAYHPVTAFRVDRDLKYPWKTADIFLPAWEVGHKSVGKPSLLEWQPGGSVIVNAAHGERHASGRDRYTGTMQGKGVLAHALGRMGADIHVTKPNAVAAMFGFHERTKKEIDFELTFYGGKPGWCPAVHMPRTGGGRVSSSKRIMRRAALTGRVQRLEYDLRPDRCDFYCDGEIFETICPADMADGGTWDVTTPMDLFFSVEHHDGWAGWGADDYAKGGQMIVHRIAPKAVIAEAGEPLPAPDASVDSSPRTINGGAWVFTPNQGKAGANGDAIIMSAPQGEAVARVTYPVEAGARYRTTFSVQGYLSVNGMGEGWAGLSTGTCRREFIATKTTEGMTFVASRPADSHITGMTMERIG